AHRALFNTSKTTIGVLQRYAINGGAALALACDLLAVGEDAYLQVGEVQIGMAAPYNLAWLSLRHTESVTATLALLGERLNGPELVRLGVAQLCVDDAQLLQRGRQLAEQLAGYEGHGLKRIKAGMRARTDITADAWFDRFTLANPSSAKPRPKASPNPRGTAQ
ncbi:MAG: enoyl-CoA hydratase-related protein, partial [Pseudomonadota bacterium]